MAIECSHPRPDLVLPAYTPPRLQWQVPAYLSRDPDELRRQVLAALQGIYNEQTRRFATPTVVPLFDTAMDVLPGQVVRGIGDGQVLNLLPTSGLVGAGTGFDPFVLILPKVANPVTVALPDGTTRTLSNPGVYTFHPDEEGGATGGPTFVQPPGDASPLGSGVTSDRLLGRDSAGTGEVEEITVGGGIAFTGTGGVVLDQSLDSLARTGVRLNSTGSTFERRVLNLIEAGAVQIGIADDAGDEEVDITVDVDLSGVTYTPGDGIDLVGQEFSVDVTDIVDGVSIEEVATNNLQRAALTGDVTASAGSNATTIANDAVTNAKAANMAANTIKGRAAGAGTGDPQDLTASQVTTVISNQADSLDNVARTTVRRNSGANAGSRRRLNLIEGTGIGLTVTDDAGSEEIDITVASTIPDSSSGLFVAWATDAGLNNERVATSTTSVAVSVGASNITWERAALTGDVTAGSNSNATTIANDAVTNAKAANMAANTIKANPTGSTADPQDLAIGTQSIPLRSSGSLFSASAAADQVLRRSGSGDLGFGSITSGNISGDLDSNARVGVRRNSTGSTFTRRRVNLIEGTNVTIGIADDSGSEEVDVTITAAGGADAASLASTSVVQSGSTLQRAALTGDVTASQNSNTTAIAAGVIVNADVNASAAIAQTKLGALTGEVTKASGGSTLTIDRSTTFTWTGNHTFSGAAVSMSTPVAFNDRVRFAASVNVAAGNNVAIGNVNSVRITSGTSLTGMVPNGDGHVVALANTTGSNVSVGVGTASSAANRFAAEGVIQPGQLAFCRYDGTSSRWRTTLPVPV